MHIIGTVTLSDQWNVMASAQIISWCASFARSCAMFMQQALTLPAMTLGGLSGLH